ncbi:MAG: hypothetical protein QM791_05585 [Ferruginibacter sp.]
MKKIILASVISVLSLAAVAQKDNNFQISVGAELGFATGSFSNTHSIGFGATAQIETPIQDKLQAVAYGGILSYNGKSVGGGTKFEGITIIPLRVGVKYFLTGSVYGAFQAGLGILGNGADGTAFSYSPQLGYEFKTNSGKPIDATFKYDAYSKNGTIGAFNIRLALVL